MNTTGYMIIPHEAVEHENKVTILEQSTFRRSPAQQNTQQNQQRSPPQPIFDEFQMKVFESHQRIKRLVTDLSKDHTNTENIDLIFSKYPYITMKDLHRSKRSMQSIIEEVVTRRVCKDVLKSTII